MSPWSSFTDVRVTTTDPSSLESVELFASAVSDQATLRSVLCNLRPIADESDDDPSLEFGAVNADAVEGPSDETVMTASPNADKLGEALPPSALPIVAAEESDAAALASIMENIWSCLYEPLSAPTPSA